MNRPPDAVAQKFVRALNRRGVEALAQSTEPGSSPIRVYLRDVP
ncbi:MAG: hypothetical protein WBE72_09175 [Terracidiphilus sp.]